jgi:MSHA pilin protein MshA
MQSARPPQGRQSGFTLIELLSVIGIAGVITAAAIPKLTALAGEARYASLQVAQGALSSVAASAHGQFMVDGADMQRFEDIPVAMVNGYPAASQALTEAAGLAQGYIVHAKNAGTIVIVPRDLAGSAAADQCYLVYTQSRTPQSPPVITLGGAATAATCS